jgi:CheY-like chemotaxis protein
MTRVVVVDDHELMAASLAGPLGAYPDVEVRAIGFTEAESWDAEWQQVDVALLDAADPGHGEDHYPGVRLARRIRAAAGPRITIAIVTSRYTDDALRARLVRLGSSGADYLFDRDDLRSADELHRFVVDPSTSETDIPAPDPAWLERHGITARTDLETVIDLTIDDAVLAHDAHLARSARPRRAVDRQLDELNAHGVARPGRRDLNATVDQVRKLVARLLGRS